MEKSKYAEWDNVPYIITLETNTGEVSIRTAEAPFARGVWSGAGDGQFLYFTPYIGGALMELFLRMIRSI